MTNENTANAASSDLAQGHTSALEDKPHARVKLPKRARETMKALIETVQPKGGMFTLDLSDWMLEYVESMLVYLPRDMRLAFPLGLLLLEYGTLPFMGRLTPFSRMAPDLRKKYIEGWAHSRFALRRLLIMGVKGLAVNAYFEHPEIKKQMGFMSQEWVEERGNLRLDSYGDEIARIQGTTS